jgi:hypothetical protein
MRPAFPPDRFIIIWKGWEVTSIKTLNIILSQRRVYECFVNLIANLPLPQIIATVNFHWMRPNRIPAGMSSTHGFVGRIHRRVFIGFNSWSDYHPCSSRLI